MKSMWLLSLFIGTCLAISCTPTYKGITYDFSRLSSAAGGYITENSGGAVPVGIQPNASYELQICGNVKSAFNCSTPSPSNLINTTTGECVSLGDLSTYSWDPNPEGDGLSLTYYHGDYVPGGNKVGHRSTRIYFLCPSLSKVPVTDSTTPVYEHYTAGIRYQYHYFFATNYACPDNYTNSNSTTTTASATTSGSSTTGSGSYTNTTVCGTVFQGVTLDLSPLFAANGSYTFTNVTGERNQTAATYEIQVCGSVVSSNSNCSATSAANMINTTTGACTSFGDSHVAAWDVNPSGNGVYITYFHGSADGRVFFFESRIYFECNATLDVADSQLSYQFENTDYDQGHYIIRTKYACASTYTSSTASATTSSASSSTSTAASTAASSAASIAASSTASSGATTTPVSDATTLFGAPKLFGVFLVIAMIVWF